VVTIGKMDVGTHFSVIAENAMVQGAELYAQYAWAHLNQDQF